MRRRVPMRWRDPSLRCASFRMTARCERRKRLRPACAAAVVGPGPRLPPLLFSLFIAVAPVPSKGAAGALSPPIADVSHGVQRIRTELPYPSSAESHCVLHPISAPPSPPDAPITPEGVSRGRNVDSILQKKRNFFHLPFSNQPAWAKAHPTCYPSHPPTLLTLLILLPVYSSTRRASAVNNL